MRRALNAPSLAALVLLAGAAVPAGAQPIPTEGPAINPSVYKVPAGARTINVDCDDTKQTLAAAIADKSTGDLNIVFSGTCKETIALQRDGVAIRGKDATATVVGTIEVTAAKRVLLENFSCRDTTQQEYCIAALYGASVTLHNIKVFNSAIRGVMYYNAVGLIEGLTVDKTGSTSLLIRGSGVRLEGEQTFSNTLEGCVTIDGVSSVFSKSGVITTRDCGIGVLIQSNSTFQAPFATFNLNHNAFAGMMLSTQGTLSFGGTIVAKNNTRFGIFVDDGSSFSPFTNIVSGAALTLENNGTAGVYVRGGSFAELISVGSNTGSNFGVLVEDGRLRIGKSKISDNKTADLRLVVGSRALFLDGTVVGTFTCDGTELVRGPKAPTCTPDDPKGKPTTTSSPTKPGTPPDKK